VRKHRISTVKLSTSLLIVKAQECLIYVYTSDVITFKAIELFSNKKIKERGDVYILTSSIIRNKWQCTKRIYFNIWRKGDLYFRLETRAAGSLESHIT